MNVCIWDNKIKTNNKQSEINTQNTLRGKKSKLVKRKSVWHYKSHLNTQQFLYPPTDYRIEIETEMKWTKLNRTSWNAQCKKCVRASVYALNNANQELSYGGMPLGLEFPHWKCRWLCNSKHFDKELQPFDDILNLV